MGCVGVLSLTGVEAQPRLTLTLSECRSMALSHSEDLQQADNKLQQAALDRKIATTNYLRNLGISFLVPYTKDFGRITQF